MTSHRHLTRQDRYTIEAMLNSDHFQSEIARTLKVDPATISREIRRDGMNRSTYSCQRAQRHAERSKPPSPHRKSPELWKIVESFLTQQQWSPEQISGYLAKNTEHRISHEAIYLHIYEDQKRGGILHTHLRTPRKKRKNRSHKKDRRGTIKHRTCIEERPQIVEEKNRIGDLELDTVIGLPGGPVLVTIVDRMSKFTFIGLAESKEAAAVGQVVYELLKDVRASLNTLTYDNGKEFALHYVVNDILKTESFFAHPYHSWERGLNEHTNGLIRQYFPKKTDFSTITPDQVLDVQNLLNSRPRKILDYATPNDIFLSQASLALPS